MATGVDGVTLGPQAGTPRKSLCHQDPPHFQVPGEGPATGAKGAGEKGEWRIEKDVASVPSE